MVWRYSLDKRIVASPCFQGDTKRGSVAPYLSAFDNQTTARGLGSAKTAINSILWPAVALVLLAAHTRAWPLTLAYCLYLQIGPWTAGRFLRSAPPGLLLPGGVALWLPDERWPRLIATPDPYYVSWVHTITGIAPFLLWVACVYGSRRLELERVQSSGSLHISRTTKIEASSDATILSSSSEPTSERTTLLRRRSRGRLSGSSSPELQIVSGASGDNLTKGLDSEARQGTGSDQRSPGALLSLGLSVPQLVTWILLTVFNTLILYRRMPAFMGYSFLLFSPGVAWVPFLAFLLVTFVP